MTYVRFNPRTKKELKERLANGPVEIFEPGLGSIPENGVVFLEGPHYPKPHTWYAEGRTENGKLVSIK